MVTWVGREVGRIPAAQAARFFGCDTSVMINGLNRLEAAMGEDHGLRGRLGALREAIEKPRQTNTIKKDRPHV
jgi:hypothetical protein